MKKFMVLLVLLTIFNGVSLLNPNTKNTPIQTLENGVNG